MFIQEKANSKKKQKKVGLMPAFRSSISSTIIQAKLEMTEPGDSFEQEADKMADLVMSSNSVQNGGRKFSNASSQFISRVPSGHASFTISPGLESAISSSRGGGFALPSSLRSQMEGSFGADFSSVRLHTDSAANKMSSSINARAFTSGKDIYFSAGQFAPHTSSGQHLIAHELTHTLQQSDKLSRKPFSEYVISGYDLNEKEDKKKTPEKRFFKKEYLDILGYKEINDNLPTAEWNDENKPPELSEDNLEQLAQIVESSDIFVFSGHHFARHGAPGIFTQTNDTKGVYKKAIAIHHLLRIRENGFPNVKLVISTACATLTKFSGLKEAKGTAHEQGMIRKLFPNALILGYGEAAPIDQADMLKEFYGELGKRDRLDLDNEEDIEFIIETWKFVTNKRKRNEGRHPGYWYRDHAEFMTGKANEGKWEWTDSLQEVTITTH